MSWKTIVSASFINTWHVTVMKGDLSVVVEEATYQSFSCSVTISDEESVTSDLDPVGLSITNASDFMPLHARNKNNFCFPIMLLQYLFLKLSRMSSSILTSLLFITIIYTMLQIKQTSTALFSSPSTKFKIAFRQK